ncbi:MAG: efflux RND transporter permease subunit [Planctomycetota bacterium]|nr:efflux RND transporter permease subunit [Planctomycetota bacterium]
MDIVRFSISKPITVAVGVILIVMFGLIGVGAIPIQLSPNVDRPIITVTTSWPGRSPEEIVDQITKEQEEQLKGIANLKSMRSTTNEGSVAIELEFYIGTDISRALQETSDALRQVPEYPPDADEPVILATEGDTENAIAWIILELPAEKQPLHPGFDITTLYDPIEKEIKPFLERIDGLAEVNIYGGRPREARVLANPEALARHGLTYMDLVSALRAENENVSAGSLGEGKRDYRVRVIGRFETARDVLDTIVAYRAGAPIYVHDIATVEIGHEKQRGFVRSLSGPAIAINATRQAGSNVMEVMADLRERLEEVRAEILPNLHPTAGPDLRLRQVYDETTYIQSAISLVLQNLWVGGIIAALVLMMFLRSFVSTGVVALAIPISVIGTFLALLAMGRTLNVISLAGLAFAVGMVVDNAIVVLENIYRRLQMGEPPMTAAYRGGREVWGAILASTLTTVAVFIPVLTIQEEAGQLFRDISLAIVASVTLSLVVSITVIPCLCSRWLKRGMHSGHHGIRKAWDNLFGLAPIFAGFANLVSRFIYWLMTGWRGWTLRPAMIILLTAASLIGAKMLMPPLDYLPQGNRNLVFGGLLIPPGYSLDQQVSIAERLERHLRPYVNADIDEPETMAGLAPIPSFGGPPYEPVPVENFFIGAFGGGMFVGATSQDEQVVIPIGQLLTNAMGTIPDAFGGARQTSLWGRGIGGGNSVNIEISGPNLDRVKAVAGAVFGQAGARYGYADVRPDPANFNLTQPELQVRLTRVGRELGLRTSDLGVAARAFFDGAFVGDFTLQGDAIDLVVLPNGGELDYKEQLLSLPITTPSGRIVPFDTVAEVVPAQAPQSIQRIEELPSVTISVVPPKDEPVEQVMETIREEIIAGLRASGMIDRTMRIRLEGTAAKLDEVRGALIGTGSGGGDKAGWQRAMEVVSALLLVAGVVVAIYGIIRGVRRKERLFFYGASGALLTACVLGGLLFGLAEQPGLATARLVWALVVTFLLMAALFESFIYPFVIMFTVPLAVVGGFAGLKIVHDMTMRNPVLAPQQLDVLTMLGFVILIGVVVNNAILLVHQALNYMRGEKGLDAFGQEMQREPLPPMQSIAESVRTRIRPIFMSTLTSVGGMAPLVLFPGAGSELYRGLGSVVIGGLLMATIFTLLLAPLMFSLVVQMKAGLVAIFGQSEPMAAVTPGPRSGDRAPIDSREAEESPTEERLQPV